MSFSTVSGLSISVSGLPSKLVNANMFFCIVLGSIDPGETVSWMDAALKEIRVSGQCGTIPRSSAFQGEAFCEMHDATALRDVCQHLMETESDQVTGSRALRTELWIFFHTTCKNISEFGSGSSAINVHQRKKAQL